MRLKHDQLEEVVFGKTGFRRFTQDSPILPDVWMAFGDQPESQQDLLLTPNWGSPPGKLSNDIAVRLEANQKTPSWTQQALRPARGADIAYNFSTVAVRLYFDEVIRVILPMTVWWDTNILADDGKNFRQLVEDEAFRTRLSTALAESAKKPDHDEDGDEVWDLNRALKHDVWNQQPPKHIEHLVWLMKIVGAIVVSGPVADGTNILNNTPAVINAFADLMKDAIPVEANNSALVWAVNINRPAKAMIWRSTTAIKADAARRLFEVKCEDIRWGVIDSGIDATHPAFRIRQADGTPEPEPFVMKDGKPVNNTRVVKTYDFTLIRKILSRDRETLHVLPPQLQNRFMENPKARKALQDRLQQGLAIDWEILAPFLEIPHIPGQYEAPVFEHGTHVAGILAADWRAKDDSNEKKMDIRGVCPDLRLYDLRVLDENGESDEFSILAALQFVLYLNSNSDNLALHGVNMSLSIRHKVKNFACGCTPVCEEAERLVNSGLVVVAAAGNDGYLESDSGSSDGYRSISITDPGNAPGVITVGATHRDSPHTYGVSYFSSRGPTGDGRIKPDLVAPGEKITSTVPDGGLRAMDGTSMAAPHVSGAAALLIARHRELVAKPGRVKQILCDTATDLGRERYFQGTGMVDILRAMQSV
jgi:serine protease AprX